MPGGKNEERSPLIVVHEDGEQSLRGTQWLFSGVCLLTLLLNYDSGAIPAMLIDLTDHFSLSFTEQGALGSFVYLGLIMSSIVAGSLLQNYNVKTIMCVTLTLNVGFDLLFALAPSKFFLLASRVGVGLSQAFIVIFSPVWVDEFAPDSRRTLWMSLLQAAVPVGIMLGYVVAGLITHYHTLPYNVAFLAQVVALVPFAVLMPCVPRKYFVVNTEDGKQEHARPRVDSITAQNEVAQKIDRKALLFQLKTLASSPMYILTIFSLCGLFFIVTGIQFWVTLYLVDELGYPLATVVIVFAVTSATAPILGVFMGGYVVDKIGGYRGLRGLFKTARFGACCALLAVVCAMTLIVVDRPLPLIVVLLWCLLFFGGAIVPGATGILLSSVPMDMRSFASSASMLLYNLFGYFAGPMIPGLMAQLTGHLIWAWRVLMGWSFLALLGSLAAWFVSRRKYLRHKAALKKGEVENEEEFANADDVLYELNRQRTIFFAQAILAHRETWKAATPARGRRRAHSHSHNATLQTKARLHSAPAKRRCQTHVPAPKSRLVSGAEPPESSFDEESDLYSLPTMAPVDELEVSDDGSVCMSLMQTSRVVHAPDERAHSPLSHEGRSSDGRAVLTSDRSGVSSDGVHRSLSPPSSALPPADTEELAPRPVVVLPVSAASPTPPRLPPPEEPTDVAITEPLAAPAVTTPPRHQAGESSPSAAAPVDAYGPGERSEARASSPPPARPEYSTATGEVRPVASTAALTHADHVPEAEGLPTDGLPESARAEAPERDPGVVVAPGNASPEALSSPSPGQSESAGAGAPELPMTPSSPRTFGSWSSRPSAGDLTAPMSPSASIAIMREDPGDSESSVPSDFGSLPTNAPDFGSMLRGEGEEAQ